MNKKLSEIIKMNKTFENIFNTLAELEINNQVDSHEYKTNLEYLDMFRGVLNKKLRCLNFEAEELIQAEEFIASINHLDDENHDVVLDVLTLEKENSVRKLIYQLYMISRANNMFIMTDIDDFGFDLTDDEMELIDQELKEAIQKEDDLDILKEDLLAHTLMEYLLDAINMEKNNNVKNELIRVKYRLLFLLDTLGNSFIKNPTNFTRVPVYQELLKIRYLEDETLYYDDFLSPIKGILMDFLDELAIIDKTEIKSYKAKTKYILFKLYLKTFISIIYDEEFIKEIIDTKEIIKEDAISDFAKSNIDDVFKLNKHLSNLKKVDL